MPNVFALKHLTTYGSPPSQKASSSQAQGLIQENMILPQTACLSHSDDSVDCILAQALLTLALPL